MNATDEITEGDFKSPRGQRQQEGVSKITKRKAFSETIKALTKYYSTIQRF